MTSPADEKPVPRVTGDDDLRLSETGDIYGELIPEPDAVEPAGEATGAPAWEPRTLEEKMSLSRLTFAQQLIGWCVLVLFVMALCQHFAPRDGSLIGSAMDTLKMVVTTALGFVFGRSTSKS
ncbi:hypothetical protein [Actinomyces gaoshouyii]|uniref:hypothetical protein n=1 Tax=Actinomyces gaoshouyii TaxID=1960083 RepID=UPI0009BCF0E0|nr:hypothetical protein [Actinomyces gaoshouyii]ARD42505.1 hypothetical protein B6G06_09260 [Actinomyces gaoshouyii]